MKKLISVFAVIILFIFISSTLVFSKEETRITNLTDLQKAVDNAESSPFDTVKIYVGDIDFDLSNEHYLYLRNKNVEIMGNGATLKNVRISTIYGHGNVILDNVEILNSGRNYSFEACAGANVTINGNVSGKNTRTCVFAWNDDTDVVIHGNVLGLEDDGPEVDHLDSSITAIWASDKASVKVIGNVSGGNSSLLHGGCGIFAAEVGTVVTVYGNVSGGDSIYNDGGNGIWAMLGSIVSIDGDVRGGNSSSGDGGHGVLAEDDNTIVEISKNSYGGNSIDGYSGLGIFAVTAFRVSAVNAYGGDSLHNFAGMGVFADSGAQVYLENAYGGNTIDSSNSEYMAGVGSYSYGNHTVINIKHDSIGGSAEKAIAGIGAVADHKGILNTGNAKGGSGAISGENYSEIDNGKVNIIGN